MYLIRAHQPVIWNDADFKIDIRKVTITSKYEYCQKEWANKKVPGDFDCLECTEESILDWMRQIQFLICLVHDIILNLPLDSDVDQHQQYLYKESVNWLSLLVNK